MFIYTHTITNAGPEMYFQLCHSSVCKFYKRHITFLHPASKIWQWYTATTVSMYESVGSFLSHRDLQLQVIGTGITKEKKKKKRTTSEVFTCNKIKTCE